MYDDTWFYNSATEAPKSDKIQNVGHQRRESLLKQPNENDAVYQKSGLGALYEELVVTNMPAQATIARRAKSYTDFYHVARAHITRDVRKAKREEKERPILGLPRRDKKSSRKQQRTQDSELLEASHEEHQLYRDQLLLTERHLDSLLEDTTSALDLLAVLSESFRSVDSQTSAFQSQCEDLLADQKRLKILSDELGTGLHYYGYLEPITRRLNIPGASRAIGDDSFVEMLSNLETCIDYMARHPDHRESETYLTRYKALLARTLNLLRIKFNDLLRDDTTQALKRIPGNRMNMTAVFVVQAPQRNPVVNELEGFMAKLQELAYGSKERRFDDRGRQIFSNYETEYVDVFRQLLESYVVWRRSITTPILDKLLLKEDVEGENAESVAKWLRDCFQAVLEIAINENAKYTLLFIGQRESRKMNSGTYDPYTPAKTLFHGFLSEIVTSALAIVKPRMQRLLDIPKFTELATWLGQYDSQTMAEENGVASSHEDDALEDLDGDAMVKSRLAMQLKSALSDLVFERMNDILLKDIEKYVPSPEDLEPRSATAIAKSVAGDQAGQTDDLDVIIADSDIAAVHVDPSVRAENVLGPGLLNAYAPVKIAIRLLTIYNDLTRDSHAEEGKNDIAYNIMHQTCQAVMTASNQVTAKYGQIDGRIFAIKNLVLLKNIILTYEISGNRRNAAIDFSPMWNSFSELRSRGGLFDVRAYYDLVTTKDLLPRVVENLEDARAELDGLMRDTITRYREECADMLFNGKPSSKGPVKDEWKVRAMLQSKLEVMFGFEKQLRDNLWAAVEESIEHRRIGNGNGTRVV